VLRFGLETTSTHLEGDSSTVLIEFHLVTAGDALQGQRPLNATLGTYRQADIQQALQAEESVPLR
jgi:hypothetical protein